MSGTVVLCGLLIVVGLFGIVVPVLPGTILVALGIGIWAGEEGSSAAWVVFALAVCCLLAGVVVKYAVPGRQLKAAVPTRTLLVGGLGAVVGFFVIPVVGVVVGGVGAVFLAELVRVQDVRSAWRSTLAVLRGVGIGLLVELTAAVLMFGTWLVGVALT
jgi:uncharacterized protein YqgC (DUF456 family)